MPVGEQQELIVKIVGAVLGTPAITAKTFP
jgi:hypothetical protein